MGGIRGIGFRLRGLAFSSASTCRLYSRSCSSASSARAWANSPCIVAQVDMKPCPFIITDLVSGRRRVSSNQRV